MTNPKHQRKRGTFKRNPRSKHIQKIEERDGHGIDKRRREQLITFKSGLLTSEA